MVFIPECREDGTFSEVQCQTSLGYCWCVDQAGKPVPGSSLRSKKPKCAQQGCSNADRSNFNHNLIEIFKSEFNRLPRPPTATGTDPLFDTEEKKVIQWKFDELDTNKDNSLKRKEVRDLRRMTKRIVKPRPCAKSFIKYCDLDQDKKISRNEWSVCLGVDINKETPIWERPGIKLKQDEDEDSGADSAEDEIQDCPTARASAMESHLQDPAGGIYIPECTGDGAYEQAQCHKSTSVCWCVNPKTGKPIRGTAARGTRPDCANVLRSARTFKGCSIQRQHLFLGELTETFSDQMVNSRNTSHSAVPAYSQEEAVRWKFTVLDSNKNQVLDRKEWITFRREWKTFLKANKRRKKVRKLRKCWRNFPRYCDENNNNKIALDEWLKCTSTVRETRGQLTLNQNRRGPNPFSTILKGD